MDEPHSKAVSAGINGSVSVSLQGLSFDDVSGKDEQSDNILHTETATIS